MFRASSCPSSGATTSAAAASGLPSELGDSSAVGRGRAGHLKVGCKIWLLVSTSFAPNIFFCDYYKRIDANDAYRYIQGLQVNSGLFSDFNQNRKSTTHVREISSIPNLMDNL
jgi:hypothetical protein